MASIRLIHDYPHSPATVWRALTDEVWMRRWMIEAVPEGFAPAVGTRFRFVGAPRPGWSGVVDGEILEVRAPEWLRYLWVADGGAPMDVTYRLEPHAGGTRFHFEHDGFTGVGGFFAKAVITRVRKRMFGPRLVALLDELERRAA